MSFDLLVEKTAVKRMLANTPAACVIDRLSLEARLNKITEALSMSENQTPYQIINDPSHYTQANGFGCIDVLEALADAGHDFRILHAMRYLWRYNAKGDPAINLRKAIWYLNRYLEKSEE